MFKWIIRFANNHAAQSSLWLALSILGMLIAVIKIVIGEDPIPWLANGVASLAMSGVHERRRDTIAVAEATDEQLNSLRREVTFLKLRMSDQDRMIMEVKRNAT